MQKVFIAVVLALALCSATAKYTVETSGWVKAPVAICAGDNACLNATNLKLGAVNKDAVSLVYYETPKVDKNSSSVSWSVFAAKLNSKDLTSSGNATYAFTASAQSFFYNGYAVALDSEMPSDNITNYYVYQTKLEGASILTRIPVTANTNKDFTPSFVGMTLVGNTLVGGIIVSDKLVNISTVNIGGNAVVKQFTLTNAFPNTTYSVQLANGEALGDSKVLAVWNDGDKLKQSVVDFSKATVTAPADIAAYNSTTHGGCTAFSTDKTIYGVLCSKHVNNTLSLFVATVNNGSGIVALADLTDNSEVAEVFPYAGYVAIITKNTTDSAAIVSKSIWNIDTKAAFLVSTKVISGADDMFDYDVYRVPGAGVYGLLANRNGTQPRTDAVVGQVLAGSYLTTVFGFLMTIVAGLFLF